MSYINKKKFETLISNIDRNSYRAFNNILNKSKGRNSVSKSPTRPGSSKMSYKPDEKEFNFPFGLKEKRFRWVTDKTGNLNVPLKGSMKHYNYLKRSNPDWEGMENRSRSSIMRPLGRNYEKRFKENSCTFRTVDHSCDKASSFTPSPIRFSKKFNFYHSHSMNMSNTSTISKCREQTRNSFYNIDISYSKHNKNNNNNKRHMKMSGTFASLMERTQDVEKKYKKFAGQILVGNNIFTPENYNYKKQRKYVSIEKERKNHFYAGNQVQLKDEVIYYNL